MGGETTSAPGGPSAQEGFPQVESNGRDKGSRPGLLRLASPEKDRRSVVVADRRPGLSLSIGLPAPLGETDPSQEGGEPDHPCLHQEGPPPALGMPIRESQEQTEQHPREHVGSPARHSTPARKYGLHVQRVPRDAKSEAPAVQVQSHEPGGRKGRAAGSVPTLAPANRRTRPSRSIRQTIASTARGRQ